MVDGYGDLAAQMRRDARASLSPGQFTYAQHGPLSALERISMLAAIVRDVLLIAFMIAVVLVGGYAVKHYNDTPAVPPAVEQPCLNAPAGTPGCGL